MDCWFDDDDVNDAARIRDWSKCTIRVLQHFTDHGSELCPVHAFPLFVDHALGIADLLPGTDFSRLEIQA